MRRWRVGRVGLGVCAIAAATLAVSAYASTSDIGTTIVVVRTVTGTLETQTRQLVIHDDVAQNEVISTAPDAASEIEFVDGTKLSLGPRAKVVLDKFVFDPDPAKGKFYMTVSEGVFRFATGHMDHQSYAITTPNGTLGVRGTEFNFIVGHDKTIVQVLDGEVFGESDDHVERSYRRGAYFTLFHTVGLSSDDDKSIIDAQVGLMNALLSGPTKLAGGPPVVQTGLNRFIKPPPVSPTMP
ncbi:MAG TPA: FecR domain-containing protein [Stellaceae bacterium]|nr:FecR domain-containing protein [Stellaceae bacterium]